MPDSRAARGRPKGTGLDDRARLLAVAQLIASDPDLKPTTAIKSTGVSDPSTIRRLRDKFQSVRDELMAELSPQKQAVTKRNERTAVEPRTAAARVAPQPKKRSKPIASAPEAAAPRVAIEAAALEPAVSVATPPLPADPASLLAMWCTMSLQGLSTALALQFSLVEKMMSMPHVATALRGQVAFNEMTLALCPVSPRLPKSLH